MNYEQALEYIHSVNWVFCKPGLDRVKELCAAVGDPQDKLKFIHVAGTNGKGSFCAMTDSVLRAAGYKVGLFTSPYIVEFNERMRIDGENISNDELCELVEYVKPYADAMQDKPTEFELITVLAFLYFARHSCDVVVLECGLGGRLDATNVIKSSVLSVITGIALDHTSILGDTPEKIAAEKAGIIKKGTPILWCGSDKSAECVIAQKARQEGADIHYVERETLKVNEMSLGGTVFDYKQRKDLKLSLLGSYQPENATNVLCAVDILNSLGYEISDGAVRSGLENVSWPSRFEIINKEPLVIADGGHNPEGIDGAVDSIKCYFGEGKVVVITGVMADKDYRYMAQRIASIANTVFCITPENPRALPAEDYADVFAGLGVDSYACASVGEAVNRAIEQAKSSGAPIVSLGSLYMYSEVFKAVKNCVK
ncbi:MAG: bifunctional folylpolyglutamate synthase/dihydrofolate synthase [Clostridia bacterium]|nr:bifunctional folylpolyglutamate synthase/dihydrofolate synthase [Clostridia bacterium]